MDHNTATDVLPPEDPSQTRNRTCAGASDGADGGRGEYLKGERGGPLGRGLRDSQRWSQAEGIAFQRGSGRGRGGGDRLVGDR